MRRRIFGIALLVGAVWPHPALGQDASPARHLEQINSQTGRTLSPRLRRAGSLDGRPRTIETRVPAGCTNLMVAIEPRSAPLALTFTAGSESAQGERTGDGVWEANLCTTAATRARITISSAQRARWALWVIPMPGMIGLLHSGPVNPPGMVGVYGPIGLLPPGTAPSTAESGLTDAAAALPRVRARVRLAAVQASGGLSADDARRALAMPYGLRDCWRDAVEREPARAGDRAVAMVISPAGAILSISLQAPDDDASVLACTRQSLQAVRFPATSTGRSTHVRATLEVRADPL